MAISYFAEAMSSTATDANNYAIDNSGIDVGNYMNQDGSYMKNSKCHSIDEICCKTDDCKILRDGASACPSGQETHTTDRTP